MQIIEELYYGSISPFERAANTSPRARNLRELAKKNNDKMLSMLDQAQKDQLEKCRDVDIEISAMLEQEAFTYGFSFAVKIMAQVMGTMEIPSIDD